MNFAADLRLGERFQETFLEQIPYDAVERAEGCFKPWDLKVSFLGDTATYEVKADRITQYTGNIAIEFACSDKPSGISTTEADFWVYFVIGTDRYYLIPTQRIRDAITNKLYRSTVRGGDGGRAELYLFPCSVFSDYVKTI